MTVDRRTFLKVLSGAAASAFAAAPLYRALADPPAWADNEFFVFVHARGGWDIMLWADPRNEARGIVDPPTDAVCDVEGLLRWRPRRLADGANTFEPYRPSGSNITFGPAIGRLADLYDRLTVINGIAMNTVSHPDGTVFSATGRHLAGGRAVAPSVDAMVASELGREKLFPAISVQFPSHFVGPNLDSRAAPLRVNVVTTVSRSLARSNANTTAADRDAVTALLTREAEDLATRSYHPEVPRAMAQQLGALRRMLGSDLQDIFSATALRAARPEFAYTARYENEAAIHAAFAVEAMKRNVLRCVSFATDSFDTHGANYDTHAYHQQELFDLLAALVRVLDATPHPTLASERLGAHTHILVVSEFCRTPQINVSGGRDHYPSNAALVISPRFRGNTVFGRTDREQLLPVAERRFADGLRATAPPDVLATFLAAFGIDPRRFMRDGDVIRELLRA